MNKQIILFLILFLESKDNLHLNINGLIKSANGLGQVTINLLNIYDLLVDDLSFLDSRKNVSTFYDLPNNIKKILNNQVKDFGVSIFSDQLTVGDNVLCLDINSDSIKYAYSMVESTMIPKFWVTILNEKFDAVLVPDDYLVDVYKKSGVQIPVFCLPLPLLGLEKCLSKNKNKNKNKKFVFGVSAAFSKNKNIEMLIKAFAKEFKDNPDVCLKIHSYWNNYGDNIYKLANDLLLTNVLITAGEMNFDDYLDFISEWDCLILVSKGEGYSITPRLAMGLGIPTILSNHTAHKTLCDTGYPLAIKFDILEDSKSEFYTESVGYNFNCDINDLCDALKEMYNNYELYLKKAHLSRKWVEKYLPQNLSNYYSQIIKFNSICLGSEDKIYSDKLVTKSFNLYQKYKSIYEKYKY